MKKITKILASALTAFALTASFGVLSACSLFDSSESNNSDNSSSNNTPTTVPIEAVELDKTALTLEVGDDPVQLTASILPEDATETVTWESEDTSIATVDGATYAFGDISAISVLGKNKLNIYLGKQILQLKGDKRFNALKYLNMYYRWRGLTKGGTNGEFLGL